MNKNSFDAKQRQAALDPTLSFIVQAPAGSGKTELLTQRLLVLLNTVRQPEEIVAITFTKKSAAEMRARIIHALQIAQNAIPPESAHAKMTFQLATRVLKRSSQFNWDLLQNPNRLRIQTIDSFNTYLTRQLPILSRFGAPPDISNQPNTLYQLAVDELLTHLEENLAWSDSIAQLLTHLDNDLNNVRDLLVNMLEKRDQWLPYITVNANQPNLRKQLESHLCAIVIDCLANLVKSIPVAQQAELLLLARFAASNLADSDSNIKACLDITAMPGNKINDRSIWHGFRELLFTQSGEWRKRLTQNEGFPAPAKVKNAAEKALYADYKERMQQLIHRLSDSEAIKVAFAELESLPHTEYHEGQWKTLQALHSILRIAVAQLHVTFQEQGQIDFIESAQAALFALGSTDEPTDLSLALDYQIKHILIDEFQDTSNSQYRLLEKLTLGWEPTDGRTLFLVGDPMQSIYRFREAEVGLFIRARKHGIGNVKLTPLTLSVNFRSTDTIVQWINTHFQAVFPKFEDISMGAVTYSHSIANQKEASIYSTVELHTKSSEDDTAQARAIVELISTVKQQNPTGTIAILIRSRNHLVSIIPALKAANLSYRAIDIDPLLNRPVIQDLLSLTRALLHPTDRIAWLSILRAPWCGLTLSDLHRLSINAAQKILWEQLNNQSIIKTLSDDGQARIARILPILNAKIANRLRHSLHNYIKSTWLLLGGPATVKNESELADAMEYFKLLDQLDDSYDIKNIDRLSESISQLYASPNNQADDSLQIMTIHNAKGLEFDTVILPHLERKSPNLDKQLLLWMERTRENNHNALILAPLNAVGMDQDAIYNYIKRQHAIKSDYEMSRLLYVAATRAKKQLHLFFSIKKNADGTIKPSSSSMLEKLWPVIKQQITLPNIQPDDTAITQQKTNKCISRLTLDFKNPIKEADLLNPIAQHNDNAGFALHHSHQQQIGTLVHQLLQQLTKQSPNWWNNQSSAQQDAYLQAQLAQTGMTDTVLLSAITKIKTAIQNTLSDPKGLWIINNQDNLQTELPLSAWIDGKMQHIVIDRTFIDEYGVRWIIDYKTSIPTTTDLSYFLLNEKNKYLPKLELYKTIMRTLDAREIRMGLYFPMIPLFHEIN